MIMRIWKHIRKYWFYIVCSLIFAALSVASQLYVPILTGNAIDHMIGVGKVDNGTIRVNQDMLLLNHHDPDK